MCTVHTTHGKTMRTAILADFSTIYALQPVDGVANRLLCTVAKIIVGEKIDISTDNMS